MPTRARRMGLRVRSIDVTVVGSPLRPTRVPRRVKSGCEGDRVMLRIE